ncbi:uncharacterized protein LOC143909224 [Arctopsyche grandis]|uniref:uncharacterized protein LOC143909224 n=1 Tax=Arctopsyche grandis TaxID=121162 RepID=UPI00406D92DA
MHNGKRKTAGKISDDDGLPMHLCPVCFTALNKAIQFREQCHRSDTLFRSQCDSLKKEGVDPSVFEFDLDSQKDLFNSIKLESQDDNDDLYVLVVNKSDDYPDPKMMKPDTNDMYVKQEFDTLEANSDIIYDENELVIPHIIDEAEELTDDIHFEGSKLKNDFTEVDLAGLNVGNGDDIHNSHFNIIPLSKDNAEIVSNSIIELENCDSSIISNVLPSEIAIDDNVTYTQEEIVVANGDETYEIVDCNISDMDISTFTKRTAPVTIIQQDDGTFLCKCGESFKDIATYDKHVVTHNKLTCPICGKGFESQQVITGHRLLHESSDSHIACPFCNKVIRRNLLTVHINTNHGPNRPTCTICKKTFATEHNRKRHMLIHLGSKNYECDICSITFNHKIAMQNHRLIHERLYELRCQNCFKEFTSAEDMKKHLDDGCNPLMEENDSDNMHICSKCGKTYSSSSSLQAHIEFVHGFEHSELLCAECGEIFSDKKAMILHSNTHRRSKHKNAMFRCKVCGKVHSSKAILIMHERVHTNERPYKCNNCTLSFKTKTHLVTHHLTHTQERRFGCSVCMKFFALKGNLVVHLRTHTGERPYICNICSQAFIDSKYLKKHKMRRHDMEEYDKT